MQGFNVFSFSSSSSSPQGFVIRAEGLCGFQIRSYITRGLTNCLPPSRLTSLNIGCTRHSQASLTLLSFARYFGITQTSLTLSFSVTTRESRSKLGLSSRCSIGWLLLSLLRRLQIPVNPNHYSVICFGVETKHVAPCAMRKSLSLKPHNTLMHGIPLLRAVSISTSLSPIYTQ